MASVNAMVHLLASAGLVFLIFFALRVQKQRDLLRTLIAPGSHKSVHIAWPMEFLRQLAVALGVDYSSETGRLKSSPQKIPLEVISSFVRSHKIIEIKLKEDQQQKCVIEIRTKRDNQSSTEDWSEKLSKALGHTVILIPS
ncbi:MAG: hypothetical protein HRU09_07160 [Oligoflexales bacterium]|nr:hypothetical protein [Oligoflexales bacterium]